MIAIPVVWGIFYKILSFPPECVFTLAISPTAATVFTLYLYNEYFWEHPCGKFLICVPNLKGVYEGKIKYFRDGQENHKNVTLRVEQNASTIRVIGNFFKEGESDTSSESRDAFFDKNNKKKLIVYYESEGSHVNPGNLSKHDGLAVLNVVEERGETTLSGTYFTNREPQTKGKIEVTRKERN
jgi:hypothetical protein